MLSTQAIAAYSLACVSSLASFYTNLAAVRAPWLVNARGHRIGLNSYCIEDYCEEFPPRQLCSAHQGFCGSWRTSNFLMIVALVPSILEVLALGFSWAFRHRKKTVWITKYLAATTASFQVLGVVTFLLARAQLADILSGNWTIVQGGRLVLVSLIIQLMLLSFMFYFRRIVKGPEELDDYDSDQEIDDTDAVSIDDDVPEEQMDFYLFNKQARRRALEAQFRSSGGRMFSAGISTPAVSDA